MPKQDAAQILQLIRDALPEGKLVSFETIKQQVGDEAAGTLALIKPKTITRRGDHYEVECAESGSVQNGSSTVTLEKKVSFDLTATDQSLAAANIKGVNLSILSFNMASVRELTITPNDDDTVTVSGWVSVARFVPSIPFSRTLSTADLPTK